MAKMVLPDLKDIRPVISDYLIMLFPELEIDAEREKIIVSCEKTFTLLIRAWEIAESSGEVEMQILAAFMRDIALQKAAA